MKHCCSSRGKTIIKRLDFTPCPGHQQQNLMLNKNKSTFHENISHYKACCTGELESFGTYSVENGQWVVINSHCKLYGNSDMVIWGQIKRKGPHHQIYTLVIKNCHCTIRDVPNNVRPLYGDQFQCCKLSTDQMKRPNNVNPLLQGQSASMIMMCYKLSGVSNKVIHGEIKWKWQRHQIHVIQIKFW